MIICLRAYKCWWLIKARPNYVTPLVRALGGYVVDAIFGVPCKIPGGFLHRLIHVYQRPYIIWGSLYILYTHIYFKQTIFSLRLLYITYPHCVLMGYLHVLISWMLSWKIYRWVVTKIRNWRGGRDDSVRLL